MDMKAETPSAPGADDIAEKKEKIADKLQKRQEERLADQEKKRSEREDSSKQGLVEYYNKTFSAEIASIEEKLKNINAVDSTGKTIPRTQLSGEFDECVASVNKLQNFLGDYASTLPKYDVQNSQLTMDQLLYYISTKRDEVIPKRKFAFSSRKKEGATKPIPEPKVEKVSDTKSAVTEVENAKGFIDQNGKDLELSGAEICLQDISLQNLTSCQVQLKGYPSAVHVNNLKNCKVFCGPVPGSIFVDNCSECTFVIACQQLRVHHTKDTNFYLHVTSRAIIEDTSSVHFAPYTWVYSDKDEDFKASGLDVNRNNWNDVDDFNWLARDKHSPNWDIIPEETRVDVNQI